MKNNTPIVSVCCITYNHKDYIKETIEGFLMQKINFPIEIIIHDDASTDGTTEILKKYAEQNPNLIIPLIQKENQFSKKEGSIFGRFVFPKAKGKYIAMCEGDDYWIDPLKLQKQVDFLEENRGYSMVFTGCKINKINGGSKIIKYDNLSKVDINEYLNNSYFMTTASLVFKKSILRHYTEDWMFKLFAGDFMLRSFALIDGNIGYVNSITCIYNKGGEGSWTNRKINNKVILKEFSDNLRVLYFLQNRLKLSNTLIYNKIEYHKKGFYYKRSLSLGGIKGFFFLVLNRSTPHYIGSYIKIFFKKMLLLF